MRKNSFLSYVLILSFILSLFVIPVFADSEYINLFDFGMVNGTQNDWFSWTSSSPSCTFTYPNYQYINYFDFIVQLGSGATLSSVTISSGSNKWHTYEV